MEWTGARYADQPTVQVQTWIAARPSSVWSLVSDIELMPRFSNELQSARWLDPAVTPGVGAKFRGYNKHEALGEWSTVSYIVEYVPERTFAWAVEDRDQPSATWRFTLAPDRDGTTLVQWVRIGPGRSGLSLAIDAMPDKEQKIVFVRLREFEEAMSRNLAAIKTLAEQG